MSRKITILGAGESGTGAAILAISKGYDVFVSESGKITPERKALLDERGIPYEEGSHTLDKVLQAELIIKSPGIPPTAPVVVAALNKGIEIIDELEFAWRFTSGKIIAITGTNGKTTTTLLTYHLLREAGLETGLAGNVGKSLAGQLAEGDKEYWVVEMSSFQLDGIRTFRPYVAILLNITPDHLDRYDYSVDKYADSKFRITRNQTQDEHLIINPDETPLSRYTSGISAIIHKVSVTPGDALSAWYENGQLHFSDYIISQEETALRGMHNASNMLSAVEAARICQVPENVIRRALSTFRNAPHRLEFVGSINDVSFFNDSKATNVDAVKYALGSFEEPLVWIAGGIDKGNDYSLIMDEVNRKVRALICLGKDNSKLRDAFHDKIVDMLETQDIRDAVRSAMDYARKHDVVLLSPACASFDLFRNYEDRGDQFREAVRELKNEFDSKSITQ